MQSTRFIGREADLASVDELFAEGRRVITLWGPAGIGKSRLARYYAERRRLARVPVTECDLGEATTMSDVCAVVADALELPVGGGGGADRACASVTRALAIRSPLLVVLDGADRAMPAVAQALGAWVDGAPEARFLVTSRQRVHMGSDLTYELDPLAQDEAIELFVDRARLLSPRFEATDANRERLLELVDRLERVPLEIETAATRIDVLGLDGLLARVDGRRGVLGRGGTQSSWDLLDRVERRALAQLSVFRASFTLAAVEAIVRVEGDAKALDILDTLRDRSLLRAHAVDESVRFSLFERVRIFASRQLEQLGEAEATWDRFAAYYTDGAAGWTLGALAAEMANLRAVHERAVSDARLEGIVATAIALDRVLATRGPVDEHLDVLDRSIAACAAVDGADVTTLLRARGNARRIAGDLDAAADDLMRAATTADGALLAATYADIGVIHHQRRAMNQARTYYERALDAARASGSRRTEARALGNLAALAHDRGSFEDAERSYRQSLAIFADLGDRRHEGIFLTNLAVLEQECRRTDDARTHFRAALYMLENTGDKRLHGITLGNLAALEHMQGNLEEARDSFERSVSMLGDMGELRSEALARGRLAAVVATLGQLDVARSHIDVAERLLERVGDVVGFEAVQLARAFVQLAAANEHRVAGNAEQSRELIEAVEARIADARSGTPSLIEQSDDARGLIRVLEKSLSELDGQAPGNALLIGPEARWFRGPGGGWQDLRRRRPLRLILLHLTEIRRAAPGRGQSVQALIAAGWPGEKMTADAGSNRVYVTLNKLRKLGLDGVLTRNDGGYLLDPAIPVERISADWRALRKS